MSIAFDSTALLSISPAANASTLSSSFSLLPAEAPWLRKTASPAGCPGASLQHWPCMHGRKTSSRVRSSRICMLHRYSARRVEGRRTGFCRSRPYHPSPPHHAFQLLQVPSAGKTHPKNSARHTERNNPTTVKKHQTEENQGTSSIHFFTGTY